MEKTVHVRFSHPLYDTFFDAEFPTTVRFGDLTEMLIRAGFLQEKKGGYHYIVDDRLCPRTAILEDYLPDPAPEVLSIRIHGLLTILT